MRTIHTNMYTDATFDILTELFRNQLSRLGRKERYTHQLGKVERAADNEILITADDSRSYMYDYRRSAFGKYNNDAEFFNWMCWCLKQRARKGTSDFDWNRSSNAPAHAFNATLSEIYFIYEFLKNRKNIDRKYSADYKTKFIGQPLDPIAAELEQARRDEVKRITESYKSSIAECNWQDWEYSYRTLTPAQQEIKNAVEAAKKKIIDEISQKWNAKKSELESQMKKELAEVNALIAQ